jgi:hypothetical protein
MRSLAQPASYQANVHPPGLSLKNPTALGRFMHRLRGEGHQQAPSEAGRIVAANPNSLPMAPATEVEVGGEAAPPHDPRP